MHIHIALAQSAGSTLRQAEGEARPVAGARDEHEVAAHLAGEAAAEGQTQPDAGGGVGGVAGRLRERTEQPAGIAGRNPQTVVADLQDPPAPGGLGHEVNAFVGRAGGVLARVVDQIEEDLLDGRRVGADYRVTAVLSDQFKARLLNTRTDQASLVRTFSYDSLRRKTAETVTDWGSSAADQTVKRLGTAYDDVGRVSTVTAYSDSGGTTVASQVMYGYDDLGRVSRECQAHTGVVDMQSSPPTPYVEYVYAQPDGGAYTRGLRLVRVRYPSGRLVHVTYGTTGGLDDAISRLAAIKDDNGGVPGDTLASYQYNGAANMVVEDYEGPHLRLDRYNDYDGNPASGTYEGFDRFGRMARQVWRNYNANAYVDKFSYGYDYNSNRLYRKNEHTSGGTFSELYHENGAAAGAAYDGLNRLKEFRRGTLGTVNETNDSITADDKGRQKWTLDAVGNWAGFKADATDGQAWDLDQTRSHNKANEIDNDDSHTNAPAGSISGGGWVLPKYDAAGNMSQAPMPGTETTRQHYKYDAWNRLVQVNADNNGTPGAIVATYRHDAAGRRIRKLLGANPASPTLALDYYHNSGGQIVEVRKDGSEYPLEQYVWSPRYVHAPVLRWRDGNTDGDLEDEGDSTLYYCNDANFNVTALVDASGTVVERYLYDPYGKVTICDSDWTPRENNASAYANEVLFTGHRLDPESGLYYTLWRHYHPTLGDWTGRDPKGYVDGMSLYEYVGGCPLTRMDAMGLLEFTGTFDQHANSAVEGAGRLFRGIAGAVDAAAVGVNAVVALTANALGDPSLCNNLVKEIDRNPQRHPGAEMAKNFTEQRNQEAAIVAEAYKNKGLGEAVKLGTGFVALQVPMLGEIETVLVNVHQSGQYTPQESGDLASVATQAAVIVIADGLRGPGAPGATPKLRSLTDIQARDWYNAQMPKIDAIEQQMRSAGKPLQEIFETTSPMRNAARQKARDLMSNRELAESLPPIKPPAEYLKKYGGDYEKALEAAKRTNPKVNAEIEKRRAKGVK
jgi:RHS repeat-associated protein